MTRHQPVNEAFLAELQRANAEGAASDALVFGVFAALGAPLGSMPDPSEYPVLGYHLTISATQVLLYVLTPGRFIRYEVAADSRSLTIAVPTHKITRVIEQTSPTSVSVTVELDADTVTTLSEYRESTDPADPAVLIGRTAGKSVRTFYELTADKQDDIVALMKFSLALRNTIGV